MRHRTTALVLAVLLAGALHAGGQMATTRLSGAAPAASAPATAPAAETINPAAMKILKRLEAAAEKYPRLTADLDYHVEMLQLADTEHRTGKVYYQAAAGKEPAKFRIHFDTLRQGDGVKAKRVVDYVFDGAWLTVRKERIKQMIRYQVAPPGQKIDPLQLGKGPFPVPFGQKAETVVRHFTPSTRPADKSDPPKADYLKLQTREAFQREMNLVWIEMWVSRDRGLPVKIVAMDRSENRTTVLFKNIATPKAFPRQTFELPRPPAGWEYRVEKYAGQVK